MGPQFVFRLFALACIVAFAVATLTTVKHLNSHTSSVAQHAARG
jgi:hypothetical protein